MSSTRTTAKLGLAPTWNFTRSPTPTFGYFVPIVVVFPPVWMAST